jgi:RNA polymerase sigma factor (sigma-70 family)
MVERQFDVFRRFNGRSSLKTYLTVVVHRLLLDWQNGIYGKWRPSVAAVRMGEHAVALERLINRDRFSADEAVQLVAMQHEAPSVAELSKMADQLPRRQRRQRVATDSLDTVKQVEFADPLMAAERERAEARIRASLAAALKGLPPDERRLLALRYRQNTSVQALARMLNADPKALYRKFDKLLRGLRRSLVDDGIQRSRADLHDIYSDARSRPLLRA